MSDRVSTVHAVFVITANMHITIHVIANIHRRTLCLERAIRPLDSATSSLEQGAYIEWYLDGPRKAQQQPWTDPLIERQRKHRWIAGIRMYGIHSGWYISVYQSILLRSRVAVCKMMPTKR